MSGVDLSVLAGGPEDGPRAMARDESLVRHLMPGAGPTHVLRSHGWLAPTLTIGRGQNPSGDLLADAAAAGISVVRRPTGGGWLLHLPGDLAVTLALGGPMRPGDFRRAARIVAQALAVGMAAAGRPAIVFTGLAVPASRAEVCFQRADRDEVVAGDTKVAGVALARFGRAALVQAAVPLVPAPAELTGFAARWDASRADAAEAVAGVDRDVLWRGAVDAAARILERGVSAWHWPGNVLKHAESLRATRYSDPTRARFAADPGGVDA